MNIKKRKYTLSNDMGIEWPEGLVTIYHEHTLLEPSKDVKKITPMIRDLIESMKYIMKKMDGVGISAPQLGENLNIFVLKHPDEVFINPRILKLYGKIITQPEGCLSIPYYTVKVPRYKYSEIDWYDEQGKNHSRVFSGFCARKIQHEYDHLQGKLINRFEKK